jgi:hypothetical protein
MGAEGLYRFADATLEGREGANGVFEEPKTVKGQIDG